MRWAQHTRLSEGAAGPVVRGCCRVQPCLQVGNAIGRRNHRSFVGFLGAVSLLALFVAATAGWSVWQIYMVWQPQTMVATAEGSSSSSSSGGGITPPLDALQLGIGGEGGLPLPLSLPRGLVRTRPTG